jgi:3-(3-hydroxy-phenyl)propionate hydroxylase
MDMMQDASPQYDTDVVIIGYGPTGIISALTLAKNGIKVTAIEREKSIYPRARAVTVNDWTMRIFQDLGVDQDVTRVIEPQRALRWLTYGGQEVMRVEHPHSTLGITPRFFNIYQPIMESKLRECAAKYQDHLQVNYGEEVANIEQDEHGVTVTSRCVDTGVIKTIRAKYAIAADGGSSPSRSMLDIQMQGDTLEQVWIVIDCRVKRWWPDRDLLTFWTDKERPVVDIALSAGNHRWEIPLKPGETAEDFDSNEKVWPLLKALGHDEKDIEIHQWAFYRHHVRMAEKWRSDRVFLAGDACHLMPPWAGAGMQSGMRDGYNLGWKLAKVIHGELPEAWLDTYETERRPNVEFFTNLAVGLGRVIKQEATEAEIAAMNAVPENTVTPHEPALISPPVMVAGWLRGEIADASIVGRMVPQPIIGTAMGKIGRLDEILNKGFVLLGADCDPRSFLTEQEKVDWDALNTSYITLRPKDKHTEDADELVDIGQGILPWMERYGAKVIAIRPDKFVAANDVHGLAVPSLN